MDESGNAGMDRPPIGAWTTPPTPPPAPVPPFALGGPEPAPVPPFVFGEPEPAPVPETPVPRRRVSRVLIGAVVVSVLLAVGTGVSLHQTSQDRIRSQAQLDQARSGLAHQQALAVEAHDELSQAVQPGRALDQRLDQAVRNHAAAQRPGQEHGSPDGPPAPDRRDRHRRLGCLQPGVATANTNADQSNNLFQQLMDETKALPVD